MITILHLMENGLNYWVEFCIILLEFLGIVVLLFTSINCFIRWLQKASDLGLHLAEGIALSLEFKLGGEVLRTVIVREWEELGILAAIILLRGLLTLLIHWEIKNERKTMSGE